MEYVENFEALEAEAPSCVEDLEALAEVSQDPCSFSNQNDRKLPAVSLHSAFLTCEILHFTVILSNLNLNTYYLSVSGLVGSGCEELEEPRDMRPAESLNGCIPST